MSKTIYVIFKRARQYDGEYVFIVAEKAFTDPQKAEEHWRKQVRVWQETVQGVECECERAILPVELEEN